MTGARQPYRTGRAALLRQVLPVAALLLWIALWRPVAGEAWLLVFVLLSGLAAGSLGLLAIGHLLGEDWLDPVRDELEAAALSLPLVAVLAVPLAPQLAELYPWATPQAAELALPGPRAAFLQPIPFLARGAACLALWTVLAILLVSARRVRLISALTLAALVPTLTLAGFDWAMSRDPRFWSTLFGSAFLLTQLAAALALAIFVSLVRFERPETSRVRSLEVLLLTLALLVLWTWYVQFLIVWAANLPEEARWYVSRERWAWLMIGVVVPAAVLSVVVMALPGAGRITIALGAGFLLVSHLAHGVWLLNPGWAELSWREALEALAALALWGTAFALLLGRSGGHPREGRAPAEAGPRGRTTIGAPT